MTAFTSTDFNIVVNAINELEEKRAGLATKNKEIDLEIGKLNQRVKGRHLPTVEYNSICKKQGDMKTSKTKIELELAAVKSQLRNKHIIRDEIYEHLQSIKPPAIEKANIINKLEELKNKYLQFASDNTRISSMRTMAAQIASELIELQNSQKHG